MSVELTLPAVRVDELISAQARRTPNAVAATFGEHSLSYTGLEQWAERAALRLRELGVTRGSLVGIHLERSLDMLVALIAVMKAGAAYVPLDPDFPADRLAHMVADSGVAVVITQPSLTEQVPPGDYLRVNIQQLLVSTPAGVAHTATAQPGDEPADHSDLIYVLYTSGSTGTPKGVALEHRNVVNFLLSMQREPGLSAADRLVTVTTLSFDIAGLELYLPLITGATVVIASREQAEDGQQLRALIDDQRATVMQATPTTWRLLIDAGWQGSNTFKVLCGGEALPRDLAALLLARCGQLWNLYGPTETAIWSTTFRVVDAGAPILIGRPIANTRIYVLDKAGRPAPTGIPGEIFIAGAGVARGYLNRPELTAERFVRDPFFDRFVAAGSVAAGLVSDTAIAGEPATAEAATAPTVAVAGDARAREAGAGEAEAGEAGARGAEAGGAAADVAPARMYRTGDSGRYLADGNLEFRSRVDNQVKIRGFRIELGEVETALESHPGVNQAVAKTHEFAPGDTRLLAYVQANTAAPAPTAAQLRDHLRARLPRYMVPQHFTALDALPLLPNGKIDRKALPLPEQGRSVDDAATQADAPEMDLDPQVRYLVDVWCELLGVRAGPQDNFFDLGGHSMLAVQMANRVARDTGVRIKLIRLGSETLSQIAADLPAATQPSPAAGVGGQISNGLRRLLGLAGADTRH